MISGTLMEAYDELGNQYKVPLYCLSRPVNILCEDFDENSPIEGISLNKLLHQS